MVHSLSLVSTIYLAPICSVGGAIKVRSEKIKSHAEVKPGPNNSQKPALADGLELENAERSGVALRFALDWSR